MSFRRIQKNSQKYMSDKSLLELKGYPPRSPIAAAATTGGAAGHCERKLMVRYTTHGRNTLGCSSLRGRADNCEARWVLFDILAPLLNPTSCPHLCGRSGVSPSRPSTHFSLVPRRSFQLCRHQSLVTAQPSGAAQFFRMLVRLITLATSSLFANGPSAYKKI
jgi:hypothetical protein